MPPEALGVSAFALGALVVLAIMLLGKRPADPQQPSYDDELERQRRKLGIRRLGPRRRDGN